MSKSSVLVIDDDTRIRNLLGRFLEENNFTVAMAKDAAEARQIMQQSSFDLLIVDVMMPNENGVELTASVRKTSRVPIIILTARGDSDDRIAGLEAGADDYLPKPFEPKELLLRINNVLKRAGNSIQNFSAAPATFSFGEFTFSPEQSRLKKGDEFVYLTESEVKILTVLCKEQGKAISRETLSALCGDVDDRTIDVQITRLRKKIEQNPKQPQYLQTVRNYGYALYA